MANEVYLITSGQYDDRTVLAVAEDRETAQAWADRWTLDRADVAAVGYGERAVVAEQVPYIPAGGAR